jgi:hypothetical protein
MAPYIQVDVAGAFMNSSIGTTKEITLTPTGVSTGPAEPIRSFPTESIKRYTRSKMAIAFGIAAVSDIISIWITFAPPLQLALDMATAFALFWIFGKRWALLPGFIAEAIPGMGVFPVWVLVVLSISLYDGFKKPQKA